MADYSQLAAAMAPDASTDAPQQENLLSLDTWKRKFGRLAEAFSDAPRLTPLDVPFSAYEGYQRLQNPDPNAQPLPDSNPMVTGAQVVNHMINPFAGEASPEVRAAMEAQLPLLGAIKAYHGSPHDFDAFDMSKIGTGEGAQAFGHGLYFAERPGVAESYRDALSAKNATFPTSLDTPVENNANIYLRMYGGNRELARRRLLEDYQNPLYTNPYLKDAAKLLENENFNPDFPKGRLYEVNLDVEPHDLLDWDKPLSEQSENVRTALEKLGLKDFHTETRKVGVPWPEYERMTGDKIVQLLNTYRYPLEPAAEARIGTAKDLREAGIPGIRYLDQGSRAAGEGSHNYVMFSDEPVSILSKK